MPSLASKLRKDLENAVKQARRAAEMGAGKALDLLAVGHHEPWGSMKDPEKRRLRNRLRAHGVQLGDVRDDKRGTQSIARLTGEVAYEHWHRMLFARYLAENERLIEPESGQAMSMDECRQLAREQGKDWIPVACAYAEAMLPEIFRRGDPVLEVTLPPETRSELEDVLNDLPREVFVASDSLGWVYQFWQSDRKAAINETEVPRGADEIPAVTQLFTEDYMVDFLLDNTLGAWWAGKQLALNPELSALNTEEELRQAVALAKCPWQYLRFIKNPENRWTPAAGIFEGWPKKAKELKCLDPCMGSGHFVVAMFERLVGLRMTEEKADETSTVAAVIRDNLFGLEIDPRCTQIGAFNLALAAWRRVGYRLLPALNLACSGLSPNTRESDWLKLAGDSENLQRGMARFYRLFQKGAVLGSLINPLRTEDELLVATFHEIQPLLEKALAQENKDDSASDASPDALAKGEMAVAARGIAKAAEILADRFTLVATNVPFLGQKKQHETLVTYCSVAHPEAQPDLSTCFVQRCLSFCADGGSSALVTPQNWWFLKTYKDIREVVLTDFRLEAAVTLGEEAWQDFGDRGPLAVLMALTNAKADKSHRTAGIDALPLPTIQLKTEELRSGEIRMLLQTQQLRNPDHRILVEELKSFDLLETHAEGLQGVSTADLGRFIRAFWENASLQKPWVPMQSSFPETAMYSGRQQILNLDELERVADEQGAAIRGTKAWGKKSIIVRSMRHLSVTQGTGEVFDANVACILPRNPENFLPIWMYCCSDEYPADLRKLDKKAGITNATLVKVPFDLARWRTIASEKYPNGLPNPHSNDPTQWLFNGHPKGSGQPLHVAVARLLAYRWPRQSGSSFPNSPTLEQDTLDEFADKDGVVCLSATKGEQPAGDRLNALLAAAFGSEWSSTKARELLAASGSKASTLTGWLSDDFFEQHCELFDQRPFVWHIWDGLGGGFSALVNYHRLVASDGAGKRMLEKLIYTYLGDWIDAQRKAQKAGIEGADARLTAAEHLSVQLKAILAGEPPFDLFVRWKPLHEQPIGWAPDINDGVRLNIRPFITAKPLNARGRNTSILRVTPKISWGRSKGTEPHRPKDDFPWLWSWEKANDDQKSGKQPFLGTGSEPDGNRWNDCHYSTATKQAARERHAQKR